MQPVNNENDVTYRLEGFELDPVRRVLKRDGKVLPLKPRVLETLLVLVRNSGRVMDKDELMEQVWPNTVVEEVNLAHNISVLRKALGQKPEDNRFIITVPGKGYGFVGEVTRIRRTPSAPAAVTEYQLAGSPDVLEETDRPDPQAASEVHDGGEDVRRLTPPMPRGKLPAALERKWLLLATVAGAALVVAVLVIYNSRPRQPQSLSQIRSIAVLPFKPLVAESRDESIEMGMADTLITRLSNIKDFSVRPIGAVRKYAGIDQDAVAAGREQKVDAVIDGHIQKAGGKIRATVRLVRVEDGSTLWTNQFDEKMTELFEVQDSISERVAGVLALKLSGAEKERLTKHPTENTEAYEPYLLGRFHLNR